MPRKKEIEFKAYDRRRWLNSVAHGGTAFIRTNIDEIRTECAHAYVSGSVDIADCSRIVSLEFYSEDNSIEHSLKKLETIMIALGEFRGKLQDAFEAAKRSKAAAARAEKKRKK